MNKIDVQIYGMHVRDDMIANIVDKLELSYDNVHYDDRPNGGPMLYTCKKAWLAPIPNDVTHRVALADDVEVCDGFWDICEQIANTHPDSIISLFPADFIRKTFEIENMDTPYIEAKKLAGCAIIMPVKYIKPCFEYIKTVLNDECDDEIGISSFAINNGVRIITTIPATVQHISNYSLMQQCPFECRTVYYEQNPVANWGNKKVIKYSFKEWFFSNHGKQRATDGTVVKINNEFMEVV